MTLADHFREQEQKTRAFHAPELPAIECLRARTGLIDSLLTQLFGPPSLDVALVALGGYGRNELAFGSDIDLLFLHRRAPRKEILAFAEKIFYPLYDLGFEVGHAVRTLAECTTAMKEDHRTESSMIDSRLVVGDAALYQEYQHLLGKWFSGGGVVKRFIANKLEEGHERLRQFGGAVYILEPNLKEGEGGLRDWHTARWISKIHGMTGEVVDIEARGYLDSKERLGLMTALDLIWKIRNALHLASGRKNDQLTFAYQQAIAHWFGYQDQGSILAVERFMQEYYAKAAYLHRISGRVIQRILDREGGDRKIKGRRTSLSEAFEERGGVIYLKGEQSLDGNIRLMLQAYLLMHLHRIPLSFRTVDAIQKGLGTLAPEARSEPEAIATWMRIVANPEYLDQVLFAMRESGLLQFFLPEFERLLFRTQHDMYHVYTVDAHLLFAVGQLAKLAQGDYRDDFSHLTRICLEVPRKEILTMAVLFHDIGKGEGSGHVERGVMLFRQIADRLMLDAEAREEIEYLVKSHLVMSHLAFRRDLEDFNMINLFAQALGSQSRLDRLYLLTFCDIRAVGPVTWTGWKASCLEDLYLKTQEVLKNGTFDVKRASEIAEEKRREVRRHLGDEIPRTIREEFLQSMAPRYFIAHPPDDIARHCRLVASYSGQVVLVSWRVMEEQGCNECIIYTLTTPRTLSNITGAMAANMMNILEIQASVSGRGYMLYAIKVTDGQGGPIRNPEKLDRFRGELTEVLSGLVNVNALVAERQPGSYLKPRQAQLVAPRVEIDNDVSAYYTVIDLYAHDRVGLLYEITSTLGNLGLFVDISRISTKVDQVTDTFYVKDIFGQKIKEKGRLEEIQRRLMDCLTPPPPAAA